MDIKQLLKDVGFRFNKQFGQNFLTDDALLRDICDDAQINGGTVLEIGAGAGTLTRALSRVADKVITFEIDRNLAPVLQYVLADCDNVQVVMGDFMKYSMPQVEQMCGCDYSVVANIPYYLTSPLVMRFAEEARNVRSLTLTVQKEVAQRLAAQPSTKAYGAITVAVNAVADVQIKRILPKNLFYPQPEVDSAVVNIIFNRDKTDVGDAETFRQTVKSAFAMRRKTLANNLSAGFGLSKSAAEHILAECKLPPNCRGEELDTEQFALLAHAIGAFTSRK